MISWLQLYIYIYIYIRIYRVSLSEAICVQIELYTLTRLDRRTKTYSSPRRIMRLNVYCKDRETVTMLLKTSRHFLVVWMQDWRLAIKNLVQNRRVIRDATKIRFQFKFSGWKIRLRTCSSTRYVSFAILWFRRNWSTIDFSFVFLFGEITLTSYST